ncbi:ABC transporter permease [Dactylosporangium sp. NPDC051541]|uniref:ABC transporter permease n=1 Tax=Dactylosporangium sp. NPDC051541 TaxID=3363977 RepID=UPI0037BE1AFB
MILTLTVRGIRARKLRLGLTMLAIVLGVAFVAGTMMFRATMDSAVDTAFAGTGGGTDVLVRARKAFGAQLGEGADQPVPAGLLPAVERVGAVGKAHGAVAGFAAVVDRQGDLIGDGPYTGLDWTDDQDFAPARLRGGNAPKRADEVAIDSTTARKGGFKVGDRVRVALAGGSQEFTLTGIFRYGAEHTPEPATTAFEAGTAQRLLMETPGTYRQILVHAKAGTTQTQLRDAIRPVLPPGFEAITGQQSIDERTASIKDILKLLSRFVLAFAGVAVFVGSFIIFNTFTMLVAQRTRELALLRAVGASRRQITAMVAGEAIVIGLAGSTLGIGAGALLALGLRRVFALLGTELPAGTLTVPGSAIVWSYTVGVLVTLVAAYLPGRRAGRIPPVAALRDDVSIPVRSLRVRAIGGLALAGAGIAAMIGGSFAPSGSAMALTGGGAAVVFLGIAVLTPSIVRPLTWLVGWPLVRLAGPVARMGRANAQRDPRRTAATASALMIGLALISGGSVIADSMAASVRRQVDRGLVADFRVTSKSSTAGLSRPMLDAIARTTGVQEVIPQHTARLRLGGERFTATAGDGAALVRLFRLDVTAGRGTALGADEVMLSRAVADAKGWTVGSVVPAEYGDGAPAGLRVVAIYADAEGALETAPTLLLGLPGYLRHYGTDIDRIDVIAGPGGGGAATLAALRSALRPWPSVEVRDRPAIKAQYTGEIDLLFTAVLVLLALSVVIAGLGIVNTLALSIIERTREIGLLRAIGLRRGQLRRMIHYEAVIVSVSGALLGLATGVGFALVVQRAAAGDGIEVLSVPVGRLALYVVAAAVIGVLAAIWPARGAARMNVLRAIASE